MTGIKEGCGRPLQCGLGLLRRGRCRIPHPSVPALDGRGHAQVLAGSGEPRALHAGERVVARHDRLLHLVESPRGRRAVVIVDLWQSAMLATFTALRSRTNTIRSHCDALKLERIVVAAIVRDHVDVLSW